MNAERRGLVLVIAILLFCAVLGATYGRSVNGATSLADDYPAPVRDLTRVLSVVQTNYAEPIDTDKAIYQGAAPGTLPVPAPHCPSSHSRTFSALREAPVGTSSAVAMATQPRGNATATFS